MKFREFEHNDFKAAIEAAGRKYDEVMFVKKSGRLRVQINDSNPFIFFRKTITVLDDQKHWSKVTTYDIESVSPKKKEVQWSEVVTELKKWLSSIPG